MIKLKFPLNPGVYQLRAEGLWVAFIKTFPLPQNLTFKVAIASSTPATTTGFTVY